MGIMETAKQGIRFFIRCVEHYPGQPETKGDGPYPKTAKGHIARVKFANMIDPHTNAPVFVYGEGWFDNAEIIEHLIQHGGGRLQFDPAEVVSKGYMTAERIAELGYPVKGEVKEGKAHADAFKATPPVLPDFHTMHKDELRTWADDHGIFLANELTQNQMVKKIQTELKAQAK